jgi:hypothetical protein
MDTLRKKEPSQNIIHCRLGLTQPHTRTNASGSHAHALTLATAAASGYARDATSTGARSLRCPRWRRSWRCVCRRPQLEAPAAGGACGWPSSRERWLVATAAGGGQGCWRPLDTGAAGDTDGWEHKASGSREPEMQILCNFSDFSEFKFWTERKMWL